MPDAVDILLAVRDRLRMGALRFARDGVEMSESAGVPKMLDMAHLEAVAQRAESHTDSDADIKEPFDAGSSMGGARPKAVVVDENGHLMLTKFTSTKDDTDVVAWEKVSLDIAAHAGITVGGGGRSVRTAHGRLRPCGSRGAVEALSAEPPRGKQGQPPA